MAEHKRTVEYPPGTQVTGTDVEIAESRERFNELTLEDGTILRMRTNVIEVTRVDDQWNDNGDPVYVVKSSTTVTVVEASQEFKKKMA